MARTRSAGATGQRASRFVAEVRAFHADSLRGRYLDTSVRKDARGWPLDPPATLEWSRKAEALCGSGIALSRAGRHDEAAAGLEMLLELLHRSNDGEIVYADEWNAQVYVDVDWKRLLRAFFSSLGASATPEELKRRGGAIAASWTWKEKGAQAMLDRARRAPPRRKRRDAKR